MVVTVGGAKPGVGHGILLSIFTPHRFADRLVSTYRHKRQMAAPQSRHPSSITYATGWADTLSKQRAARLCLHHLGRLVHRPILLPTATTPAAC